MECEITKYSIIETYPSILKHKIPLIEIFLFIVYVFTNVFVLLKIVVLGLLKNFALLKDLRYLFLKREEYIIQGDSGFQCYGIQTESITDDFKISTLEDIKPYILRTKIKTFYGKEAITLMNELIKKNIIDLKYQDMLPTSKHFIIKKEIIYCNANNVDDSIHDKVFVVKSYNEPTMIVVNLYKKLKLGVNNEHKIS